MGASAGATIIYFDILLGPSEVMLAHGLLNGPPLPSYSEGLSDATRNHFWFVSATHVQEEFWDQERPMEWAMGF